MLKLKIITQNNQRLIIIILMILSIFAVNFIKNVPSNATPTTSLTIDENENVKLNVGSTYRAHFAALYPSGALNNPDQTVIPENSGVFLCRAPQNIPYGTKIRLFTNKDNKFNQKMCVVTGNNSSSIITQDSVLEIDIIFTNRNEANSWDSQNGEINLLEVGDNKKLNFNDPKTHMTAGTPVGQSNGLNGISDPKSRELFYNKNNILFYNPDMCMLGTPSEDVLPENADLEQRAEYVIRFLTSIGFTLNQAAGIASNLDGESGIEPTCMEKCHDSNGKSQSHRECCHNNKKDSTTGKYKYEMEGPTNGFGFGITQVTGAPRQEIIFKVAKERNQHVFDMDVQLEAMLVDMVIDRPYSSWPARMFGDKCGYRLANKVPNVCINQAKTVKEAAFSMIDNFEAPGMAINCGYLAYLNKNSKECSMKKKDFVYKGPPTKETAERTYQHYIETRVKKGEVWAEKWRGVIQDGGGVTREGLIALLNSGVLRNRSVSTRNFELEGADLDLCDANKNNKRAELIKLVKKTTWPLFCKKNAARDENGKKCNAAVPMDYYKELTECRKYRSDSGPCKVPGGYVGAAIGQDCGGFVTTLMQESEADSEYNHHKGFVSYVDGQYDYLESSSKWRKIFNYNDNNFDSSLLMPGDVAICSEKKDGCPSSGHTFMYIGEIEGFEYQAASASYFERYPMAGTEIKNAHKYNWYRNKDLEASSDVSDEDDFFDPRQRSGDGKLSEGKYKFVQGKSLSEMEEIAKAFRDRKISQDGRGKNFCDKNQRDDFKRETNKDIFTVWPNKFGCNGNNGRCLQFANYHADKINRGMTNLGTPESVGGGGGMMERQIIDKDKRVVLSAIYNHINSGKTAVLLVNGSANQEKDFARKGSRHFVTVVGYKSNIKNANDLKETDLAIIDSYDAKLKAMDAPNNRFMILDQNNKVAEAYTSWRVDLKK